MLSYPLPNDVTSHDMEINRIKVQGRLSDYVGPRRFRIFLPHELNYARDS